MDDRDRGSTQIREFARLLGRAFAHRARIRQQQSRIRRVIALGNSDAVEQEWQTLAGLILEDRMVSRHLRSVFDEA